MTRYFVHSNGERSKPFPGLNGVAEEMVDRWLTNPDPDTFVEVRDSGTKRELTPVEFDAIVRQLVTLAQDHRQQGTPFESFSMEDLFGAGVFG